MSSRKYANDYRLENVPDKDGRLKTVPVYKGSGYRFCSGSEELASVRTRLIISAAVFWIAQITSFMLTTKCAHFIWVVLPQAFSLLPFGYFTMGVWMMLTAKEPMTREFAEKMRDRISAGSCVALILNGAACTGSIVAACVYHSELMLPADVFYIILLFAAEAACILGFVNRGSAAVRADSE